MARELQVRYFASSLLKGTHIRWLRITALGLVVAIAWYASWRTGLSEKLNKQDLQQMVLGAGVWGLLLYLALFCAGIFMHVPGLVFVAGSLLIYGYWLGIVVSFLGGLVAISVSFWSARMIGGDPLTRLRHPRARAIIGRLREEPLRTMAVLRVFMQMSPALNVVLALSGVRFRDYLLAACMGMWVPVVVMATALQYFLI